MFVWLSENIFVLTYLEVSSSSEDEEKANFALNYLREREVDVIS